jgi:hypothetical protein
VREDHGPDDVVVAVDGVDAVEERDAQARLPRDRLIAVVHVGPAGRRLVGRRGAAAAEDRAEEVVLDVRLAPQGAALGLGHLADLLVERHVAEERLDVRVRAGARRRRDRRRRR